MVAVSANFENHPFGWNNRSGLFGGAADWLRNAAGYHHSHNATLSQIFLGVRTRQWV